MKHPKQMARIMNELLAKFHFLHKSGFLTERNAIQTLRAFSENTQIKMTHQCCL